MPECLHQHDRQRVLAQVYKTIKDDHKEDKAEQDQPDQIDIIAAHPHLKITYR
jgi:hypothetical protein